MDPVTMAILGISAGAQFIGGQQEKAAEAEARGDFMSQLQDLGGDMKAQYEDFVNISKSFLTGGQAIRDAQTSAIDTAFMASEKGEEKLLSKGVGMTSYGSSVFQDVVKEKYTKDFTKDYMELSKIGVDYATLGQKTLGEYTDLMSSAAQVDYMGEASQTSMLSDLGDLGMDLAGSGMFEGMSFGGGGGGGSNPLNIGNTGGSGVGVRAPNLVDNPYFPK